jgi:hypothetical protein
MKTMLFAAALAATSAPSEDQLAAVRDALDARLLDYPSARFREVTADDAVVCGKVNAKNRAGAFTGWVRFGAFYSDGKVSLYVDDAERPPLLLDLYCGDSRAPKSTDYSDRLTHR